MGGVRRRSQAINKAKGPSERVAFLFACVIQRRANDSLPLSHVLIRIHGHAENPLIFRHISNIFHQMVAVRILGRMQHTLSKKYLKLAHQINDF
jgi:hypothetical protein